MNVLVTGGAGFIGSSLVKRLVAEGHQVLNVDRLSFTGCRQTIADLDSNPAHELLQADICDAAAMTRAFSEFRPDWVMHLAAESHVDRSIHDPASFIQTNIVGTYTLLEAAREHWNFRISEAGVSEEGEYAPSEHPSSDLRDSAFRFLHVSTDEVYGSLGETGHFTESTRYDPHSPYSASKASSDHLALAWYHTYGLPVIVTHCSNNYGPYQFSEKLIPVVISKALSGQAIPIYGRGENVRDWLHVDDHADALLTVASKGEPGETYNIGGNNELRNIDLVQMLCRLLDECVESGKLKADRRKGKSFAEQITFVADRPGHDFRYAIDAGKIKRELSWEPRRDHQVGLRSTVQWYLDNQSWWKTEIAE